MDPKGPCARVIRTSHTTLYLAPYTLIINTILPQLPDTDTRPGFPRQLGYPFNKGYKKALIIMISPYFLLVELTVKIRMQWCWTVTLWFRQSVVR